MATKTKATTLADNIATHFPEPDGEIQLHHKNEAPDLISILRFRKHLEACALKIPLPNKPLGLLGDILDPKEYLNIIGVTTAFTAPTHPGNPPPMPMNNTTTATAQVTRQQSAGATTTNSMLGEYTNSLLCH